MKWVMRKLRALFGRSAEPTVTFASVRGDFSVFTPVMAARKVMGDWRDKQLKKGKANMAVCPGMFDFSQAGYIVVAHCDIHIKANSAGVAIRLERLPAMSEKDARGLQPQQFDYEVVEGMFSFDGVAKRAKKIPLPWGVFTKKGWSAHVVPAPMHSDFLDKISVYSGTIDYDRFHVLNFVFTPIKDCDFVIYAGTPLLQIIPFKREDVTAVCRKATEKEIVRHDYVITTARKHFYRKNIHVKKHFSMEQECPYRKD